MRCLSFGWLYLLTHYNLVALHIFRTLTLLKCRSTRVHCFFLFVVFFFGLSSLFFKILFINISNSSLKSHQSLNRTKWDWFWLCVFLSFTFGIVHTQAMNLKFTQRKLGKFIHSDLENRKKSDSEIKQYTTKYKKKPSNCISQNVMHFISKRHHTQIRSWIENNR